MNVGPKAPRAVKHGAWRNRVPANLYFVTVTNVPASAKAEFAVTNVSMTTSVFAVPWTVVQSVVVGQGPTLEKNKPAPVPAKPKAVTWALIAALLVLTGKRNPVWPVA